MSSHVRPAGVVSCPGRARIVMSLTWTLVTVSLAQLHPWEGNPKTTTRKQAGRPPAFHGSDSAARAD